MRGLYDPRGFYSVIVIDPNRTLAVYHAPDWVTKPYTDKTLCGLGPVGEYRWHEFRLLDPDRVRPCKRCYGSVATQHTLWKDDE